jgi:diketogulonate reductase-like aldo/keto reductase
MVVITASTQPPRIAANRIMADGWELIGAEMDSLFALDDPQWASQRSWATIL